MARDDLESKARALLALSGTKGPDAYIGALLVADFMSQITGFLRSLSDR